MAVFLVGLAGLLLKTKPTRFALVVGYALILGGGLGNLIDRIANGSVTDFIVLGIGDLNTGIFNFADVAIVCGVALLLWNQTRGRNTLRTRINH